MRAVVYTAPGEVSVQSVPTPVAGEGEVLLRVLANTICGTDLRIARGIKRKGVVAPRVLGHEVSAEVVEVGGGVDGVQPGDRVCVSPTYPCGSCTECHSGRDHLCRRVRILGHQADGGLADYLLVPADAVRAGVMVPLSADTDWLAAALAEPLSCVLHGQEILQVSLGETVVVMGGGAIGLLHAAAAKLRGARTVIVSEPVPFRREMALRFGADFAVDPITVDLAGFVAEHTNGEGADAVIVCIGVPSLVNEALSIARNRARVSLFAGFPSDQSAPIDANLVHYKELSVVGSSNSTVLDLKAAVELIESGRVPVIELITHRFPLEEFDQGVQMINQPESLKVAIVPSFSRGTTTR